MLLHMRERKLPKRKEIIGSAGAPGNFARMARSSRIRGDNG